MKDSLKTKQELIEELSVLKKKIKKLDKSESKLKLVESEVLESEERHRLLAENANDVIWTMSLDGRITYVSPSVERMRGFTPEEAMNQSLGEILTPDSAASSLGYWKVLAARLQDGLPPQRFHGEYEYYCKDGSTVWTDVQVITHVDSNGQLVEILGVTRDITERKQAEAEKIIFDAQNRQIQKSESLGRMAAAIAHHFNNQLGVVIGNLEMAMDELPSRH